MSEGAGSVARSYLLVQAASGSVAAVGAAAAALDDVERVDFVKGPFQLVVVVRTDEPAHLERLGVAIASAGGVIVAPACRTRQPAAVVPG